MALAAPPAANAQDLHAEPVPDAGAIVAAVEEAVAASTDGIAAAAAPAAATEAPLPPPVEPVPIEAPMGAAPPLEEPIEDAQPSAGEAAPPPATDEGAGSQSDGVLAGSQSDGVLPSVLPTAPDAGTTGATGSPPLTGELDDADPAPLPVAAQQAPSEWVWIWTWNCADPVEYPKPTGPSWTWIWRWNCNDSPTPTDDGPPAIGEQYHAESPRYQDENIASSFSGNSNVSIRIFSPGDDGAVNQLVSTVSTATSAAISSVAETTHQAITEARATVAPALADLTAARPTAPELAGLAGVATQTGADPLGDLLGNVLGGILGDAPPPASTQEAGRAPKEPRARRSPEPLRRQPAAAWRLGPKFVPTVVAAATTGAEQRAAAARPRPRPDRASPGPPSPRVFGGPTVVSGAPAPGGGSGGAIVAFLAALALSYVLIPPDITRRVLLAGSREPRGVDSGEDDPPG